MAHGPIPDKPKLAGMTVEEASSNFNAFARKLPEQELRNIMAITGCKREQAELLRVWLRDPDPVIAGFKRIERDGLAIGERLAKAFGPLAAISHRYRS